MANRSSTGELVAPVAFALHARKGAYAALIGSGVSTAAGAPTGWKIVELLIRELAIVYGETIERDPFDWYKRRHGAEPTYAGLVAALGLTPAERQALIGRFLADAASPAQAHLAVARLVAGGWIRVIITTNFDRLLETALAAHNIQPIVLATADAVRGALPLVHAGPVVVKLHGDQHDPRILNTAVELDKYTPAVNRLLDQIFDEYGLIVSGWSADHDSALRSAIERCKTRRFSTFWAARSPLTGPAADLARHRDAVVVEGLDADTFFGALADACEALGTLRAHQPESVAIAVATAKRELSGNPIAISVHDTFRRELERVRRLAELNPKPRDDGRDQPAVVERVVAESATLTALTATLAYWGDPTSDRWWTGEIPRIAGHRPITSGSTAMIDRPRLPALFLAAAGGTAAVAAARDDLVISLLTLPETRDPAKGKAVPAVLAAAPDLLHLGGDAGVMYRLLRPAFVEHLGLGVDTFIEAWERWQYLLHIAAHQVRATRNMFIPSHPLAIRVDGYGPMTPVPHPWFLRELDRQGSAHPLAVAFFDGDTDQVRNAAEEVAARLANQAEHADFRLIPPNRAGALPSGLHYPGFFTADPDKRFTRPDG